MTEYLIAVLAAALLNHAVLVRKFGSLSQQDSAALGGLTIAFMTAASAVAGILYECVLAVCGLEFLAPVVFLLTVAALFGTAVWFCKNYLPERWSALEIYLPLTGANCAVLGVLLDTMREGRSFGSGILYGFGAAVLLALGMMVFNAISSRMAEEDLPAPVRGTPSLLLCAALICMALMGLEGLSF